MNSELTPIPNMVGRELDRLVAVEVFGAELVPTNLEFAMRVPPKTYHLPTYIPHYSADWAGAGLVVQEMQRNAFWFELSGHGRIKAIFCRGTILESCSSNLVGYAVATAAILAVRSANPGRG